MKMTVEISTARYEWAHRRKPRGYGLWYFQMPDGLTFSYVGSYASACRAAADHARALADQEAIPVLLCG